MRIAKDRIIVFKGNMKIMFDASIEKFKGKKRLYEIILEDLIKNKMFETRTFTDKYSYTEEIKLTVIKPQ